MNSETLRARLLEQITRGQLRWPDAVRRVVAQRGQGQSCLVCDERVTPTESAYTVFEEGPDSIDRHAHRACFVLWMETLTARTHVTSARQ